MQGNVLLQGRCSGFGNADDDEIGKRHKGKPPDWKSCPMNPDGPFPMWDSFLSPWRPIRRKR